jgi:L-ascorbate metabolism protein UlaG (beta-lactamase superfamily)
MRLIRLFALSLAFCAATLPAMAQDRIPSHCFALAQGGPGQGDGPETIMRAAFGDSLAADRVRIHYVDHASFVIETPKGIRAVTDYTGYTGLRDWVPDVVTMNNAHGTHWTARPDPRIPHVLEGWADAAGAPRLHEVELGEMLVRNVPTDVRSRFGDGARVNGNSIFVFEVAGLCIGHLGHLHHVPDDAQFASIGRLDVVMVPVDGGYTMAVSDMAEVVKRLRSSVVIPMHWFSGASLNMFLEDMRAEFEVVETGLSDLELSLRDLPGRPTIMVLEPALID